MFASRRGPFGWVNSGGLACQHAGTTVVMLDPAFVTERVVA
ncbi:MAG: hypothetical protein QOF20_2625 [Acidimicrobiaceae bacterium]|jgi:hypothetical protein|nr:hypothetical protein [Acidimicrobiaceae bacterium]MDQ1370272.1 hypothetical protein [Acidimicrobiaceae bacterium]MDQ1417250.1 hypothetical protein [Acidimicrobiaceae bacterium]